MDVPAVSDRADLDAWHELDAGAGCRVHHGFEAGGRVVVGDADHAQPGRACGVDQRRGSKTPVRCGGVRVKINHCGFRLKAEATGEYTWPAPSGFARSASAGRRGPGEGWSGGTNRTR